MKLESDDIRPIVEAVTAELAAFIDRREFREKLALDAQEAADALGVTRTVLRDCRLRGELVGSKVGKKIVYEVDELKRFLARQRTDGNDK